MNETPLKQQSSIVAVITRLVSKKFKTRVCYYSECKYTVDWCNYRLIPIWHSLCFWFDQGHPGITECWSTDLWDYKTAENIASSIKSKNDLRNYYKKDEEKERIWREEEKMFWKKNAPYRSKVINGL